MRFRGVIELSGKTATGVEVPAGVVAGLGPGKRPKVRVTINGYTYRSSIAPMGGRFMFPVSAEVRAGAGVAAGDDVDVDIELDDEPRTVAVPADLADALGRDPDAQRTFDELSYSNKQRYVLSIEGAKTAQTRQRRIDKAIGELRGVRRF
jgi:Domain of unknown function (DUF1905)/Bacteriocin-protection, YdeI or OmpD-Associated